MVEVGGASGRKVGLRGPGSSFPLLVLCPGGKGRLLVVHGQAATANDLIRRPQRYGSVQ